MERFLFDEKILKSINFEESQRRLDINISPSNLGTGYTLRPLSSGDYGKGTAQYMVVHVHTSRCNNIYIYNMLITIMVLQGLDYKSIGYLIDLFIIDLFQLISTIFSIFQGYIELLSQLTKVGDISKDMYQRKYTLLFLCSIWSSIM